MARALDWFSVFSALLHGGHICERSRIAGTTKRTLHCNLRKVGHITERQFTDMCQAGLLRCTGTRSDKSGDILNFYELTIPGE